MIEDHVLGRPSTRFRKYQVFTVLLLWTIYLSRSHPHGPQPIRRLSTYLSRRLTIWRAFIVFSLTLYASRNFARVVGLESPEPLANLYKRSYFRATWVTTALDAGFWTAMHMRPKWVKDLASVVFTLYYLVCAEQADEMVHRVRGGLTLAHLRVSWDKPNTPYVSAFTAFMRPKMMKYPPRQLRIPRPSSSSYTAPINAWLYFDGPIKSLKQQTRLVLDIPGGGFVAMDPRCHDDKLMAWAAKLGIPILALDYGKAPEFPYPYALNECYDAYHSLITSRGQVIGLAGTSGVPQIVVSGDSAGGNLAVGLMCMLLTESPHAPEYISGDRGSRETSLPIPEALVLVYPALDMNIRNWMTDEQMALIRAPERRRTNRMVLTRKRSDYRRLTPNTPHGSGDEDDGTPPPAPAAKPTISIPSSSKWLKTEPTTSSPTTTTTTTDPTPSRIKHNASRRAPAQPTTRLAMSSMISYFADRILSPEMLRAMIILYIGPHSKPDFATDHLLSPILCPEALLARFPKTYFLTGERDPLVDDTMVFAGRLRQAKEMLWRERREMGLVSEGERFDEGRVVEVLLIPGVSHGFLQFVSLFPEGRGYILQCARWMKDAFRRADEREAAAGGVSRGQMPVEEGRRGGSGYFGVRSGGQRISRNHRRRGTDGSEGDDRPLEMSASLHMTSTLPSNEARRGSRAQGSSSGRDAVKKTPFSGRHSPIATRRSLVRLGSTEDLMGRRMHGLTGNLMGMGGDAPFTP
ncbi:hypothetical protein LTR01_000516 [Friedmanniomyces endolithicus]|nr:hypothetical protein LTR01_000516 [Friedmanniomyces endolithicus]KAK0834942.1 hypothetical protein LTR73_001234 [Friedmanniomyces endolithicus]